MKLNNIVYVLCLFFIGILTLDVFKKTNFGDYNSIMLFLVCIVVFCLILKLCIDFWEEDDA